MDKMKRFVIELNQQFDTDREIMTAEIEYLKSQKDFEI